MARPAWALGAGAIEASIRTLPAAPAAPALLSGAFPQPNAALLDPLPRMLTAWYRRPRTAPPCPAPQGLPATRRLVRSAAAHADAGPSAAPHRRRRAAARLVPPGEAAGLTPFRPARAAMCGVQGGPRAALGAARCSSARRRRRAPPPRAAQPSALGLLANQPGLACTPADSPVLHAGAAAQRRQRVCQHARPPGAALPAARGAAVAIVSPAAGSGWPARPFDLPLGRPTQIGPTCFDMRAPPMDTSCLTFVTNRAL